MKFKLSDIEDAYHYASTGFEGDHAAYLNMKTGEITYSGELDDLFDEEEFYKNEDLLQVPGKHYFDHGKYLVFQFVRNNIPECEDDVLEIFSRRGTYSRFRDLLESKSLYKKWGEFENQEIQKDLIEWCSENNVEIAPNS